MRRLVSSLVLVVLSVAPVAAVDVTTCGQVVPPHEAGVLVSDLDCSGMPSGSDGVVLGNQSSLDLQGHSLVGPPVGNVAQAGAVACQFGAVKCKQGNSGPVCTGPKGRCHVFSSAGTAHISGNTVGVYSDHDLVLENVALTSSVEGAFVFPNGKLVATNVTATASGGMGLRGAKLVLSNVASNDNGEAGIWLFVGVSVGSVRGTNVTTSGNAMSGITGGKVNITGLTAIGNGSGGHAYGAGVSGGTIRLVNSTVTGNLYQGEPIDIVSTRRPRLINTVCGRSLDLVGESQSWGVCAGD